MQIKNQKTGKMICFGGKHFKRLLKLQETTRVEYFTENDRAVCVAAAAAADKKIKMSKMNETAITWLIK